MPNENARHHSKENAHALLILAIGVTIVLARLVPFINLMPAAPPIVYENFHAVNNTYDLRDVSFDGRCAVIQHNPLYYADAYVLPEQIETAMPTAVDEETGIQSDFITQRFTLLMPENRTYRLQTFAPSMRLYVNGKLYAQNGNPGYSWKDTETQERNVSVYVTPVDGKIDVVAHTAVYNFHDDRATPLAFWVTYPETSYNFAWDESRYVYLVVGILLGSTVLLLLMFLARKSMTQNLWFALACLALGLRYGGIGQYDELTRLFPFISGNQSFVFEHMGFPLVTAFMMLYLHKVFPSVFGGVIRHIVVGSSLLYAALVATIDPRVHTWLMQYYQWILYADAVWIVYRLARRLRNPEPEQYVALYGIIVFFMGTAYDFLRYNNFDNLWGLPKVDAAQTALVVCYFSQMLSLYIGNNRAADTAKEAERAAALEVRQLEKINQLKTEFLANISHELKTPLTVISGYAQENEKKSADAPDIAHSMKLISSEADRLALMVSQVLDVTRIDEGRMSFDVCPCSLSRIVQDTLSTYYPAFRKNNNQLTVARNAADPVVLCDAARVSQVLVNLISNASRHTHDGTINIAIAQTGVVAEVSVSDTGEGIAPENMATLFERYKTRAGGGDPKTGTGLGLYLSKCIVEEQGGTICVQSEPNVGTTVRFTLPLAKIGLSESGTAFPA